MLMHAKIILGHCSGILVDFWSQSSHKLGILGQLLRVPWLISEAIMHARIILGQLLRYLGLISEANAHAC